MKNINISYEELSGLINTFINTQRLLHDLSPMMPNAAMIEASRLFKEMDDMGVKLTHRFRDTNNLTTVKTQDSHGNTHQQKFAKALEKQKAKRPQLRVV